MADDAFALSPISARAAQPSDEDYGAIHEAFMETARGRWFLTEYAKRNRNADTCAVLDAVARIEDTLARQKPAAEAVEPEAIEPETAEPIPAAPDPRLAELEQRLACLVAEIRDALIATRHAMPAREPRADLDEALASIRHAGQMVQGVAWTLRESGADGRICTLLDQQAKAIAGAVLHPAFDPATPVPDPRISAIEVFAAFEARIHALLEQGGMAFDIAAAPKANPSQPKIIVPNDDFEIVEHEADHVDGHVQGHVQGHDAGTERADAAAPHHVVSPDTASRNDASGNDASDHNASNLYSADLDAALFDDAPASAQPVQNPAASLEPVTLGAVIADAALKAIPPRNHSDPLAPFARMTKAERIAFFS